jgi:hypothetical protein
MSQAMLVMMDALGELAHRYRSRGNWSFGGRYAPYSSLYGLSGYPRSRSSWQIPPPGSGTAYYPPAPGRSPLDGVWLGGGGEIVLVMYGHFRVYANAENYRDGRFTIVGDRLLMYDPRSDHRLIFDYYLEPGHMYLRSETGAVLAFKQLPIPIPPFSRPLD